MAGPTVTMVDRDGNPHDVPADEVAAAKVQGLHVPNEGENTARLNREATDELYGGTSGQIAAGFAGALRGGTLGASDVLLSAAGGREAIQGLKEANPTTSTLSEIGGAVLSALPTGGASLAEQLPGRAVAKLGARLAEAGEGASALSKIGRGALGGSAEGALYGAGSGVSELALSDDPVTLERAIGTISSHALYGGAIGGAAGSLGKVAEIGLTKGRAAVDAAIESRAARNVTDDLAAMDAKQLRAARDTELEALRTTHKAETEAVEATRVTERESIADDIKSLRREVKDSEQWATVKDLEMPASGPGRMSSNELGAQAKRFDKQLQAITDNPIELAKNPTSALRTLRGQENSLQTIIDHGEELRAAYVTDGLGGKRLAALEAAPAILEKNRALQQRIEAVSQPNAPVPTSSPRLDAIVAAKDALTSAPPQNALQKLPEQMLQGSVFGLVTGAVAPVAGHFAPVIGAAAAKFVTDKVFGRLGKAAAESATRTAKAVSRFLDPAAKATRATTPLATKVLSNVRFAAEQPTPAGAGGAGRDLPALFRQRSEEIRSQTMYAPDGSVQMRPEARAGVNERLKAIAAIDPVIADRLETIAVRRIEFLASKLPRRPDIAGTQVGPDRFQFSDMEMRQFARFVAGAEDPTSIIDRLADGTVSPEDAEVMRAVYPETLQDLTRQIVEQLPTVRKTLPFQRQIALTILTGVPVHPATDPKILRVLQAQYATEEGSAGGSMAPRAQPTFGSVSKSLPEPTPSQKRAG
jgi:hypothetical protein